MTGQPERRQDREDAHGQGSDEQLNQQGVGLGMGDEATTFEPEETPQAIDGGDDGQAPGGSGADLGTVVERRELVPDDERADDAEAPREVLPDAERGVDDESEPESERLLPDPDRPVPGGPDDD